MEKMARALRSETRSPAHYGERIRGTTEPAPRAFTRWQASFDIQCRTWIQAGSPMKKRSMSPHSSIQNLGPSFHSRIRITVRRSGRWTAFITEGEETNPLPASPALPLQKGETLDLRVSPFEGGQREAQGVNP